jgi:hypothetical protein
MSTTQQRSCAAYRDESEEHERHEGHEILKCVFRVFRVFRVQMFLGVRENQDFDKTDNVVGG